MAGLFFDTDDFKLSAPDITRNYDFDKELSPKIELIVRQRLFPFISEAEYLVLETAYQDDTLSAAQESLLKDLKPAIAHFVYTHLLTANRLRIASMGVQENRSEDGSSGPASFHAIQDVKEETIDLAYGFLNSSLVYMDANKASFAAWAASASYTRYRNTFVYTPELFEEAAGLAVDMYSFLSLKPYIKLAEKEITAAISMALKEDLLSKDIAGTLSAEEEEAVRLIREWQAPLSMLKALPYFRVKNQGPTILLRQSLDGPKGAAGATNDLVRHIMRDLSYAIDLAKTELLKYFEENSSSFPDFPLKDYDLSDGDISYKLPDNSYKKSFRV